MIQKGGKKPMKEGGRGEGDLREYKGRRREVGGGEFVVF